LVVAAEKKSCERPGGTGCARIQQLVPAAVHPDAGLGPEPSHGAVVQHIAKSSEEIDSAQQPSGEVSAPLQHLAGVSERLQQLVPAAVHPDAGLGLEPSHGAVAQQHRVPILYACLTCKCHNCVCLPGSCECQYCEVDSNLPETQAASVEPESAPSQLLEPHTLLEVITTPTASQPHGPLDATPAPQPKEVLTSDEQKASPGYPPATQVALFSEVECSMTDPLTDQGQFTTQEVFNGLADFEKNGFITSPEEKAALPELCGDADQGGKDYGAAAQQDESQSIFSQGAVVQQNEPREGETTVDMRKRLQKDIGMELFGDLSSDESQEGCVFIACWRFGL